MYKRQAYKYHDLMYTETGKNTVLPKFLEDITNCKPTNIRYCKTIVYIAFHGKYSGLQHGTGTNSTDPHLI